MAAPDNIKKNSKSFFKYAKKFKKSKSNIKLRKQAEGSFTTNDDAMANLFQEQFTSVFSEPLSELRR